MTENANDKVTAKGKPSGIATTITVTPIMKKSNNSPQCLELSQAFSDSLSIANLEEK